MTSQISMRKLLLLEIRQNGWMFGLAALGHFLTGPVLFLLVTSHYETYNSWSIYRVSSFFTDEYFIFQLLTMIACMGIAIFTYRYLFNRRMVDLYHSVPISRTKLFLLKYLHGLLLWLIPFFCNVLCVTFLCTLRLLGKPYLFSVLFTQLKTTFLLLLCFFLFYHLFLTAVYLSGNVLNMLANIIIMGCAFISVWGLCYVCAAYFLDTYCYTPSTHFVDTLFGLSPLTAPFAIFNYLNSGGIKEHMTLLMVSILVLIGLFLLAWKLCLMRPSEQAERGTLLKGYILPARFVTAILCGLGGSLFFGELVTYNAQTGWGIFGALLCSLVVFGAMNSVFAATIKAFLRNKLQMLMAATVSVLMIMAFQFDWFGYDTYLPEKEEIAGVTIYGYAFGDDSTYILRQENGYLTRTDSSIRITQETVYTDQQYCYDLLDTFIHPQKTSEYATYYYVKVKLTNGRSYMRCYTLPDAELDILAPIIESEDYKAANYKLSTGALGYPLSMSVELWNYMNVDVSTENAKRLLDAYWQDFEEHYTLEELSSGIRVASLDGYYEYSQDYSRHHSLQVFDTYTRTLAVLKELYPEYIPAVSSAQDIKYIELYGTGDSEDIEGLYQYFGYGDSSSEASTDLRENTYIEGPYSEEIALAEAATMSTYCEYKLSDPELIEVLFPYLYFGTYKDTFHKDEYIYVGSVTTHSSLCVNAYVKPATLPEEFIKLLYENPEEIYY